MVRNYFIITITVLMCTLGPSRGSLLTAIKGNDSSYFTASSCITLNSTIFYYYVTSSLQYISVI